MIKYIVSWVAISGFYSAPDPVYRTNEFGVQSGLANVNLVAFWHQTGRQNLKKEFLSRDSAFAFYKIFVKK